nr:hypothetical protein [Tanacetum cinerariifolium]
MSAAGGPAVGMEPLPVGTSIPPARTVAASMEVKTLAISSESLLILSAAASPSFILLPLIGASSLDCLVEDLEMVALSSSAINLDSVGQASPSLTSLIGDAGSSATVGRAEDRAILALFEYCLIGVVSVWVTMGIGAVGRDGSGIDEVVGCDVSASGEVCDGAQLVCLSLHPDVQA